MKWLLTVAAFFLVSCLGSGTQPDPEVPGQYILQYCAYEHDCFEAARDFCAPKGFQITKYGSIRPEKFVCTD
jgi:hypothetical protein